jgi:hypothetical protein
VQESLRPRILDPSLPADEPLTPAEVSEMKRHLRFLSEHRRILKLRVNAAEDLLLNGARQPEHRGICVHLLGKVDHASISSAVSRLPDAAARSRFLAGVVRFSTDPGVLLLYLESLSDAASRKAAAGAFSRAVQRLDFAEIGEARMRRVLELVASIFTDPYERAQVVFGLLHSASFQSAFGEAVAGLPAELSGVFESLSVAFDVVVDGAPVGDRSEALRSGVLLLIKAPEESLCAYPQDIRVRLLRVSLELMGEVDDAERAVAALLESLPHSSDEYREVALRRARELLRLQVDVRARWQLRQLRSAQPGCREATELLAAMEGPCMGRMALGWPGGGNARRGGLMKAFWLDYQSRVWLRVGDKKDASALVREGRLSRPLTLAGVATVLVQDKGKGGEPFIAVAASGDNSERPLDKEPRDLTASLWLARQGLQALGGLHSCGLVLPDAQRRRFLIGGGRSPGLTLADLSGLEEADPEAAEARLTRLAQRWCRDLLGEHMASLSPSLRTFIERGGVSASDMARALSLQ